MIILGLQGGFTINQHDPSAALVVDGKLVACVEEERLYRVKTPRGFLPIEAIAAVLKEAGLKIEDVDYVAHPGETYDDLPGRIEGYFRHHFGHCPKIRLVNHQTAHLASAYFHSGFDRAMCLSYDAFGDRLSAALGVGIGNSLTVKETRNWDNSLGHFYATMTSFLGFQPGEDEYKVMGLAPYGADNIDLSFFARPADGGYHVDRAYIHEGQATVFEPFYTSRLVERLGAPRRKGEPVTQWHRDIARATQRTLEECATSLVTYLHQVTGEENLCLAGGVALNCSCNNILRKLPFVKRIFVQPAASDRGLSLGAALQVAHEEGETIAPIEHVFMGPTPSIDGMRKALNLAGFDFTETDDPAKAAADLVAAGGIVGWFQGRSEFGPRALGHRSILADPSRANMKDEINARVKFREEFRPFAPSVTEEAGPEIFDLREPSPYMTVAVDVREGWGERLPAITHVNNTARVQTISAKVDPLYHRLISLAGAQTGQPVVLNTSFNVKGQPIVERPLEALSTFAGTGMDALVMGPFVIRKPRQARA